MSRCFDEAKRLVLEISGREAMASYSDVWKVLKDNFSKTDKGGGPVRVGIVRQRIAIGYDRPDGSKDLFQGSIGKSRKWKVSYLQGWWKEKVKKKSLPDDLFTSLLSEYFKNV